MPWYCFSLLPTWIYYSKSSKCASAKTGKLMLTAPCTACPSSWHVAVSTAQLGEQKDHSSPQPVGFQLKRPDMGWGHCGLLSLLAKNTAHWIDLQIKPYLVISTDVFSFVRSLWVTYRNLFRRADYFSLYNLSIQTPCAFQRVTLSSTTTECMYRCLIKFEVPGSNSGDENRFLRNTSSLMFLKIPTASILLQTNSFPCHYFLGIFGTPYTLQYVPLRTNLE